jgi:predicted RNase H-like nuclease (RuvC/YqgF family)
MQDVEYLKRKVLKLQDKISSQDSQITKLKRTLSLWQRRSYSTQARKNSFMKS